MHYPHRARWSVRDILALTVVALCALIVLAALLCPDADFERLLPMAIGALVVIVQHYFGKRE